MKKTITLMKNLLLLAFLFNLASCAIPMSVDSFQKEVRKNSSRSSSLKQTWKKEVLYKGSEEEYHYFYINPGLGLPRTVKVKKDDLYLAHEYPYTDDSSVWLPYSEVN